MPTKTERQESRYSAATTTWPWSSAALRMTSSLRKGPKGGDPVMARKPAIQRTPETGRERRTPAHLVGRFAAVDGQDIAGDEKSIPLVSE